MSWFWLWFIFVIVFLIAPLGYGYPRWGYPYPTWTRRAREARAQHLATWGILANFIWFVLLLAIVWFLAIAIFY